MRILPFADFVMPGQLAYIISRRSLARGLTGRGATSNPHGAFTVEVRGDRKLDGGVTVRRNDED